MPRSPCGGPVLAWALAVQGVGLVANTVGQFVLNQQILPWLSPWLVSLLAAVVVAVMETVKEGQDLGEAAASRPGASQRPRRGTPAPLAGLLAVVLLGAGGFALTAGVRYAVGYVSGNETGPDVLVADRSGRSGDLTVTVDHVFRTRHFTRVEIVARNDGSDSLTLPVFHNSVLTAADGTSLDGDPFRSDWGGEVTPGGVRRGVVVFPGHLVAGTNRVTFSFVAVFGRAGGRRRVDRPQPRAARAMTAARRSCGCARATLCWFAPWPQARSILTSPPTTSSGWSADWCTIVADDTREEYLLGLILHCIRRPQAVQP